MIVDSCTIGAENVAADGGSYSAQVICLSSSGTIMPVVNTAILGGRFNVASGAYLYCTNCLLVDNSYLSDSIRELAYNCIITNSAAMQVEANTYRPVLGSFAGIDAGEAAYSSDALGDKDFYGTPRVLNGKIDIGAVEYDWRPTFAEALGKRFTVTYASPSVTTNATGGLLMSSGEVAGTVTSADPYLITFEMSGGNLAVFVGGVLAGECSGRGEQSIRFTVADAADEVRFVYTPDAENPGSVVLKKLSGARGFSISFQ